MFGGACNLFGGGNRRRSLGRRRSSNRSRRRVSRSRPRTRRVVRRNSRSRRNLGQRRRTQRRHRGGYQCKKPLPGGGHCYKDNEHKGQKGGQCGSNSLLKNGKRLKGGQLCTDPECKK